MNFDIYSGARTIVTGGASFIGSRLVEKLVDLGAEVVVVDDFSTGLNENLASVADVVSIVAGDLADPSFVESIRFEGVSKVFHLAAIHGGRGFIESQQNRILTNLVIDQNVFRAAVASGVETIVHASSACAYPTSLQSSETSRNLLSEGQANFESQGSAFPDGVYGWVKLMGEFQLQNLISGTETRGRSARIFTAYGERENESHAAIALTAKALLRMDPFPVWGSGNQTRNFTYVSDTVHGLVLLGSDSRELQFDVFNVGQDIHWTVSEFLEQVFIHSGFKPTELVFQGDRPTGVGSRASDNSKMREVFGWAPEVDIAKGVQKTVAWYRDWTGRARTIEELTSRL